MPKFKVTIDGQAYSVDAPSADFLPGVVDEILASRYPAEKPSMVAAGAAPEFPVASPEAQAQAAERPPGELKPILFTREEPPQPSTLNPLDTAPSENLAFEYLKARVNPEPPTEAEVSALHRVMKLRPLRASFDEAVSQGRLTPSTQFDPTETPELASAWEAYKKEMAPSMAGAAARGAVRGIGPALGGIAGASVGGLAGAPGGPAAIGGALLGGVVGARAGGVLQESILPKTEREKAQQAFDISQQQVASRVGEMAPGLIGNVPTAFSRTAAARAAIAAPIATTIDTALFEGRLPSAEEAATSIVSSAILGGATKPGKMLSRVLDRGIREQEASQRLATEQIQKAAVAGGFTPEQTAENIQRSSAEMAQAFKDLGLNVEGFKQLTGDISQNEGIQALQNGLETAESTLRAVRLKNKEIMAKAVKQGIETTGEFKDTQDMIRGHNADLLASINEQKRIAIELGNEQAAAIYDAAEQKLKTAQQEYEQGLTNSEQHIANQKKILSKAQLAVSTRPVASNEQIQNTVFSVVQKAKEAFKKTVSSAYDVLKQEMAGKQPSFENTKKAIRSLDIEMGDFFGGGAPKRLKDMLSKREASKKNKTKKQEPVEPLSVSDLLEARWEIAGESRLTENKQNTAVAKKYAELIGALDADIDSLGAGDAAKNAKALRTQQAEIFENLRAGDALRTETPSTFIDEFLGANPTVESVSQLKKAIGDDESAKVAVGEWMVNRLISDIKTEPTTKSFNDWKNKISNKTLLENFPEAAVEVEKRASQIIEAEKNIKAAESAKKTEEVSGKVSFDEKKGKAEEAKTEALNIEKEQQKRAEQKAKAAQKSVEERASTKLLGQTAEGAVSDMMNGKTPVQDAAEIMGRISGSKPAVAGMRNALANWLNLEARKAGQVVASSNDPHRPLQAEELEASLAKLNTLMVEGTDSRKAIETIFGKDSKQIRALDLVRRQIEISSRKFRQSAGQSTTAMSREDVKKAEDSKTTLQAIDAFARGARMPGASMWRPVIDFMKVRWRGDAEGKARALLLQSMTDGDLAVKMLRGVAPTEIKEVNKWLRPYISPAAIEPYKEEKQ